MTNKAKQRKDVNSFRTFVSKFLNMGIGGSEIFLILLVVLIFFGADKLPELARGLGKGMREFKKAAEDIKSEINNNTSDIKKEMDEVKEIREDINKTDIYPN
jgi:sec-independent protein translocase protein TatA